MTTAQEDQQQQETVQKNTLHVMDGTGDSRFMWDPSNMAEVEAAKAQFDSLKSKGYLAYTVDESGARGEVIREFNPTAAATIMAPQTVGG